MFGCLFFWVARRCAQKKRPGFGWVAVTGRYSIRMEKKAAGAMTLIAISPPENCLVEILAVWLINYASVQTPRRLAVPQPAATPSRQTWR
jgi:hypothetical protein